MIRIIVYKFLEIGLGKMRIEEFESYLKSKETPQFNNLAYPQGLYLSKIDYPFLNINPQTNNLLETGLDDYWIEV